MATSDRRQDPEGRPLLYSRKAWEMDEVVKERENRVAVEGLALIRFYFPFSRLPGALDTFFECLVRTRVLNAAYTS